MERRQLKKQKSRLQATGEEEAPKLKYPPPPPPPPPAVVARLPTKTKTGMEGQGMMRPAMDLSEEIVRRRTTLREVRILLTALVCWYLQESQQQGAEGEEEGGPGDERGGADHGPQEQAQKYRGFRWKFAQMKIINSFSTFQDLRIRIQTLETSVIDIIDKNIHLSD